MRVLLLNTHYRHGGAGRAACRLHDALMEQGVDARMLVQTGFAGENRYLQGPQGTVERALALYKPALEMLPLYLYRRRNRLPFSVNYTPDRVARQVAACDPDLIHLHWVNCGLVRIETLKRLTKPLVWTLHDSWAFTGGCHIPLECTRYREACGKCPALGSHRDYDLSRLIWLRKHLAWRGLPITIVTPSRWLAQCARASSLFRDLRIEVIPNGLDLGRLPRVDKALARSFFGLHPDKKYILFGAVSGTSDRNKGFHFLAPALQQLAADYPDSYEVLVFGSEEPSDPPDFGLKARYLGYFHDELSMGLLYSAVDLFVAPSLQENLPNTIMEAMACGTPCVAFRVGGIPDLIDHEENGYLAEPFDTASLAHGIRSVLADEERQRALGEAARRKVEREFSVSAVAARHRKLYEELLAHTAGKGEGARPVAP